MDRTGLPLAPSGQVGGRRPFAWPLRASVSPCVVLSYAEAPSSSGGSKMTIRAAQAHRPPPRLGALATGAGGTGRGHGCGRAARTGLGTAARPPPHCSFLGLGAGLWSSVLPLHSSRMGGPCQAASLLLREPGGELAFHPQPRPGRVPTDHPRNSLGPPSGPLRQAFPPPGLWRGLCILRLSLGEALAGEDGGGEQLAPRLWAGHLEEHQHAVLKRWGGAVRPQTRADRREASRPGPSLPADLH